MYRLESELRPTKATCRVLPADVNTSALELTEQLPAYKGSRPWCQSFHKTSLFVNYLCRGDKPENRFFFQRAGRTVTFANLAGHQPETLRPIPTYYCPIFASFAMRLCALCLGASVAKSALICVYLRLNFRFQTTSQRKSTVAHSKSTVDSGCELLIRGKNGLQPPASSIRRRLFHPITTTKRNRANQKPTETGQNLNRPTVDPGCSTFAKATAGLTVTYSNLIMPLPPPTPFMERSFCQSSAFSLRFIQ